MEISMEQNLQQTQGENDGAFDEDGRIKRTGNVWSASAHIITAVIDPGILTLAWAIAQLGWVAGPILMILFSFLSFYTSSLLADCYRTGDPISGDRNYTYSDAVYSYLGEGKEALCAFIQYLSLFVAAIGHTIDSSISMRAILQESDCFNEKGNETICDILSNPYMIIFGFIQIIFSQIPNFDQVWWLATVASVMSFTFSSIALGLVINQVIEKREFNSSLTGIMSMDSVTKTEKIWSILRAFGDIAFSYTFSIILIEIQDTIKAPPPSEAKVIKKATFLSITVTTFFYMAIGCIGYAGFGDSTPDNLLTENAFKKPSWLINIANAAIVIHLIGLYQLFSQPLFAFIEKWAKQTWPDSNLIYRKIRIPFISCNYKISIFRLVWRSAFVVVTTIIPMLLPFFNEVVGVLSALGFWPLTVYFPVEMYIVQKNVRKWSFRWFCLHIPSFVCLFLILAAAFGAVAFQVSNHNVE